MALSERAIHGRSKCPASYRLNRRDHCFATIRPNAGLGLGRRPPTKKMVPFGNLNSLEQERVNFRRTAYPRGITSRALQMDRDASRRVML
jgi:hypothetical protein